MSFQYPVLSAQEVQKIVMERQLAEEARAEALRRKMEAMATYGKSYSIDKNALDVDVLEKLGIRKREGTKFVKEVESDPMEAAIQKAVGIMKNGG